MLHNCKAKCRIAAMKCELVKQRHIPAVGRMSATLKAAVKGMHLTHPFALFFER